jgi:excisionase family DNA binding protein
MSMATVHNTEELPAVLTVAQIQGLLGLSRPLAYALVHRRGFPAIRFGRTIRVPRDQFLAWLRTQAHGLA